ncbi:MAG: hypothetical protein M1368_05195 [Thaumarchaeota archaeon]|nr:hypothetical protein [Nitrososphaerota archaeon]
MKTGQLQYDPVVTVYPGMYYAIYVCPRTGPKNEPDNQTDGQNWGSYCVRAYIVTKNLSSTSEETLYPPVIDKLDPQPATVNQSNHITVTWSSSTSYDKYVVGWTQDGVDMAPQDINQSGTTGSWSAPTVPGHSYTFHVNGGISQFWNYRYSAWGPTSTILTVPNLTSLRQYLLDSGINPAGQSLRSLMTSGETLRKFMQLS